MNKVKTETKYYIEGGQTGDFESKIFYRQPNMVKMLNVLNLSRERFDGQKTMKVSKMKNGIEVGTASISFYEKGGFWQEV